MRIAFFALIVTVLFLSVSCNKSDNKPTISSGRIDYKITYISSNLDKKTLELLPKKMKLLFNEKRAENNIEGFMGFYRLNSITTFHTRSCSTLLKVFDKNYLFKGKRDELMCCFDAMEDMEIQETEETKYIAGFNCRKSIVSLPSTNETFTIYYTEEIDLKHANSTNPYKKVNGVLMEFELTLLEIRMRFTAEEYRPLSNTSLKDKLPDNLKEISRNQMVQIMQRLMK